MYDDLIKRLRNWPRVCAQYDGSVDQLHDEAADALEELLAERDKVNADSWKTAFEVERDEHRWIPVTERLPECEQEVLICTEKKLVGKDAYIDSIVTPAIYEDGTMLECDSIWHWEDIDYAGWDEENDCGIIPEGWWENRHFNPDEVYNNPVDRKVIAWMPLPEPPKEAEDDLE